MPAKRKTYSNANKSCNKSKMDIIHNIISQPIRKQKKRRIPKLEIKELQPLSSRVHLSDNSSIKLNTDNTFDRLVNATIYNKVSFKPWKEVSARTSLSKSSIHIDSHIYSPVKMKRTKRRQNKVALEISRSPVLTRSLSRSINSSNTAHKMKKTLERTVDESLCIDNEVKINVLDPTCHFKNSDVEQTNDKKDDSISYEHVFSDMFIEKYNNLNLLHPTNISATISSTPVHSAPRQNLIDYTISPISNVSIEVTPKVKKPVKTRELKITSCVNDTCQNEQENICSNIYNHSSELIKEIVNVDSCDTVAIYKKDQHKNLSKLWQTPIVNITHHSMLLPLQKNQKFSFGRSTSISRDEKLAALSTRTPFGDLTNKNMELRSKSALVGKDFTKVNMKNIPFVNITMTNIERYLSNIYSGDNESIICISMTDDVYQPVIDLTNMNVEKLKSTCIYNTVNHDSEYSTSLSCESSKSVKSGNLEEELNVCLGNKKSSIEADFKQSLSEVSQVNNDNESMICISMSDDVYQPVVDLTNMNVEKLKSIHIYNTINHDSENSTSLNCESSKLVKSGNLEEANVCLGNKKASIKTDFKQSLLEVSQVKCLNNSERILADGFLKDVGHKLGPYITLRNRRVFHNTATISKKYRNRSKSSASGCSEIYRTLSMTQEDLVNFNGISTINFQDDFNSLGKHEGTNSHIFLSDESSNSTHDIDTRNKSENVNTEKGENKERNSQINTAAAIGLRMSPEFKGFDGSEIEESNKKVRNMNALLTDKQNEYKSELDTPRRRSSRNMRNNIRKSLFQMPENPSPDLFDDFELSQMDHSILQPTMLDSLSVEMNSSSIISIIDSSYLSMLDINKKCQIFSLNRYKRNRISTFEQFTAIEHTPKKPFRSPILPLTFLSATPIRVTKRRKVYYTPFKHSIVYDNSNISIAKVDDDPIPIITVNDVSIPSESLKRAKASKSNKFNLENGGEVPVTAKKNLQLIAPIEEKYAEPTNSAMGKLSNLNSRISVPEEGLQKKTVPAEALKIVQEQLNNFLLTSLESGNAENQKVSSKTGPRLRVSTPNINSKSKTSNNPRRGIDRNSLKSEIYPESNQNEKIALEKSSILNSVGNEAKVTISEETECGGQHEEILEESWRMTGKQFSRLSSNISLKSKASEVIPSSNQVNNSGNESGKNSFKLDELDPKRVERNNTMTLDEPVTEKIDENLKVRRSTRKGSREMEGATVIQQLLHVSREQLCRLSTNITVQRKSSRNRRSSREKNSTYPIECASKENADIDGETLNPVLENINRLSTNVSAQRKTSRSRSTCRKQNLTNPVECASKENADIDGETLNAVLENTNRLSTNVSARRKSSRSRDAKKGKQSENCGETSSVKSATCPQNTFQNAVKDAQRIDDEPAQKSCYVEFAVPALPTIKTRDKSKKDIEELVLKPGKLWRRSLVEVRNRKIGLSKDGKSPSQDIQRGDTIDTCPIRKNSIIEKTPPRRFSVRVVPLSCQEEPASKRNTTVLENYAASCRKSFFTNVLQDKSFLDECFENLSLTRENTIVNLEDDPYSHPELSVTARDVVFRKCGQTEPIPFEKCYPNSILQHCQKIGEGVYGEVFLFRRPNGGTSVMKVIPIEGDLIVNGERQKKFEEILSEITIAMELSNLRNNPKNNTNGFTELYKVVCAKGKYPARLIELWELFGDTRRTENDHPEIFDEDQLYVILELANGGSDMESFVFNNAQQAHALVTQVACALAVAESSLEFEHRDLHWGNVLISHVSKRETVSFCLDGRNVTLDTHGIRAAVIDFTLSRISHDGVCIYNDLSQDPDLFTATGDCQFDVYRSMRKQNRNKWQHFEPYSNVLWLHYLLDKAISGVRYKNKNTKVHKTYIMELIKLKDDVLEYKSAEEFVNAHFINNNVYNDKMINE